MSERVSVIICTFNGEQFIESCLQSLIKQDYPDIEVLIVDGGSTDSTLDIVARYTGTDPRFKLSLIKNPNRLPEGHGNGKWLGYTQSTGSVVSFIDQDNILQRSDLLTMAVKKLRSRQVLGILGGLTHDRADSRVVRYVALFGTDSFLAYRSLDFIRNLSVLRGDYQEYTMKQNNMLLAGGNCFFYRRQDIVNIGGYSLDVLVVHKLLERYPAVGVINAATKHYAEHSLGLLVTKKFKWGEVYFRGKKEKFAYFPSTAKEFWSFTKNLIFNLSIVLNIYYAVRVFIMRKDLIAFLYPLMSFMNALAYASSALIAVGKHLTRYQLNPRS